MNVTILCVGKLKERYFADACAEFCKRLSRYMQLTVAEVADEKAPETLSACGRDQVLEKEGGRLLARIPEGAHVVALCVEGKQLSSEAFAARLSTLRTAAKPLVFVIGGSLGLSDAVRARADGKLSLSEMTLPHRIARLVLLEQVYRACKINAGETYHK